MKYHASFIGCLKGAIGIHYPIRVFVDGADPDAARLALYETYDHISGLHLLELPIRYVATYINRDGMRTLAQPAQGRCTFALADEAQAWIDAVQSNNGTTAIAHVFGPDPRFEVRPVHCWPGHFDPIGVYFDTSGSCEVAR